jgi:hypothetical protein
MSEQKVNKISPRTACGTTTLGDSGDTFTIPAGVSITNNGTASGFGATGAASWNTTVKTSDFTAVAGEGYFVDTTSGEVDVALPAGTAGAVVAVADYANTADTNNIILKQNGSEKIEGSTDDFTVNVEGASITLVYVDSTKGWITTDTGQSKDAFESPFPCATGGTITNTPTCRIHTFTGPGTFTVNSIGRCASNNVVSYLVVAGGGSGSARNNNNNGAAGGGAGGFREDKSPVTPYTASPLDGAGAITLAAGSYPIAVGGGGAAVSPQNSGNKGSDSTFSTITSAGGGLAGGEAPGGSGGSGGGGSGTPHPGGAGNTPPVSPAQGTAGGDGSGSSGPAYGGGGGGGATVAGTSGSNPTGGPGGTGATTSITGSPVAYAGGGGGSAYSTGPAGSGGTGGGGAGNNGNPSNPGTNGGAGTANTGGGGGGNNQPAGTSGAGGSGVVIIRYKIA